MKLEAIGNILKTCGIRYRDSFGGDDKRFDGSELRRELDARINIMELDRRVLQVNGARWFIDLLEPFDERKRLFRSFEFGGFGNGDERHGENVVETFVVAGERAGPREARSFGESVAIDNATEDRPRSPSRSSSHVNYGRAVRPNSQMYKRIGRDRSSEKTEALSTERFDIGSTERMVEIRGALSHRKRHIKPKNDMGGRDTARE